MNRTITFKTDEKATIEKAYHLLQAFDYYWVKKKDLVALENGTNAAGQLNYILCTTKQNLFEYKFSLDSFAGWKMESKLIK